MAARPSGERGTVNPLTMDKLLLRAERGLLLCLATPLRTLEAERRGQFDQIVDAQLPVLAGLRRAGAIPPVFQWPTYEDRLQSAVPRRRQVAGVRRDQTDLLRSHGQYLGGAQVGLLRRLVGPRHLGPEDRIPRQAAALGYVEQQDDVTVRQGRD